MEKICIAKVDIGMFFVQNIIYSTAKYKKIYMGKIVHMVQATVETTNWNVQRYL